MDVKITNDFEKWEEFLKKEYAGNIFQSPVIISAYSKALGFNANLLIAQTNGEILGGMLIYRRFPPQLPIHIINELYTSYGPIVAREVTCSIKNKLLLILLKSVKNLANINTIKSTFFVRQDFIYERSINSQSKCSPEIFVDAGFKKVPGGYAQTFVINLEQDLESLIRNSEKRTRWSLSKAKKLNIKAFVKNKQEGLQEFYNLYINTAKRHNSIITPFNLLNELYNILLPKGLMNIYVAYFDEIPVASAIILTYKDTAYYYMAASLKKFHYTQAATYLQFFIMNDLKNKNIREYDLLCAPASDDVYNPQYGLYLFKRSFGGTSIPIFHYEQVYNKVLVAVENRFLSLYKKVFRT